jgi:4-amino-4-deoxy-L-arabinose transferase-like glycosyltransferase
VKLLAQQTRGVRARRRLRTTARRVPAPLAALLAVVLLFGIAWALVSPAWQAPDENAHFAYTQTLAERLALPGRLDRQPQSSEQLAGAEITEADQVAAIPEGRPPWSAAAQERFDALEFSPGERADGGGVNPAASNPPLYYLYAAGAYRLASGGDVFTRLYAERLAGLLWLLVTVAAAWLLAGELLGRRRSLQLVAAAIVGLVPMMTFVSASVSPDGMLYALWSLALWLGVRVLRRGVTPVDATALAAVTAAAILVKATSFALLPAVALALVLGSRDAIRSGGARRAALANSLAALSLAVPLAVWSLIARGADRGAAEQLTASSTELGAEKVRHFLSYVWQFYLPNLPFQDPIGDPRLWETWVQGGFGRFGWLEVMLPEWLYIAAAAFTVMVLAGLAVLAARSRRRLDVPVLAFLALAAGTLLAGLHWTDFNFLLGGSEFMQGRYLLPLIALAGVAAAAALTALPYRWRPVAAGMTLGGLFVAQLIALATTLTRFYA